MIRRILATASLIAVLGPASSPAHQRPSAPAGANPCDDPQLALRCPNLRMAPPSHLRVDHYEGSLRLLATNRIVNVGQGPLELHARRGRIPSFAAATQVIRRTDGLALLFTPPFDQTTLDPGYIKGYPPGIRENGGQYTHAAVWSVIAFAMLAGGVHPAGFQPVVGIR